MSHSHISYNYSPMSEVFLLFLALGLKTKQPWNSKPQSHTPQSNPRGVKQQSPTSGESITRGVKHQSPTPEASNPRESKPRESNTRGLGVQHQSQTPQSLTPGDSESNTRVKHHRVKHQGTRSPTPQRSHRVKHYCPGEAGPLQKLTSSI